MMRLIFNTGPRAGTEINTSAPIIKLGRDPTQNDLVFEDLQVSGRHCVLTRSPRGTYVLEDLGSSNGTFVNERRIANVGTQTAVYLTAGDKFRLGGTEIEIAEGRPRLMILSGERAGRDIPIGDEAITIGRAPDNTIDFEDPDVSVYHAAILCLPEGFVLKDNGSTNGSFVNGKRVERHTLEDGDSIGVGDNELRFLIDEPEHAAAEQAVKSVQQGEEIYAYLDFVAGPHEDISVPLGEGQVTFGRRGDNTFTVNDLKVSGFHCAITRDQGAYKITDLQSTNGTYLNGERITETRALNPGDLLEFGQCVTEFRLAGGVTTADAATAMTTVLADGAYQVASQPKFVIDGHVESKGEIWLGRSPSCEMRLEGEGVSGQHCFISWQDDGFYLEDRSRYGTYLNDRRAIREKLQTGHVIKIGSHVVNVTVRGERCTLETIDAAAAMAAIELARERQFNLSQAVPDPENTGGGQQSAYKTVFKLEAPDTEALVAERKAKFKQGAPAWRPSSDIKQEPTGKVAVVSALIAAAVVAGIVYFTRPAEALVNHPLSQAHSSVLFTEQASEVGGKDVCSACHSAGASINEQCVACHEDFEGAVRKRIHGDPPEDVEAHAAARCTDCHGEHEGLSRESEQGAPTMLGAGANCSQEGCHPNQHSEEFLAGGAAPPQVVEAGPVPTFDFEQKDFHVRHAVVEKGGEQIGIGCTSCHARGDESGQLVQRASGKACFHCHDGGQELVNSQCASCHKNEHPGASLERPPEGEPGLERAMPAPSPGNSLLEGGAIALSAFVPLLLFGAARLFRRQKRTEKMVQELQEAPTEVVKRLVHSINLDKCVGCAMCVQACPASVLELVNHKSVVVNFDACIQCRKCEQACAFDALRMHEADKPPPMIQMPEIDRYYQTPVEGMYLIGQASGTPQVKNASNLGRAVVQHMYREGLRGGAAQQAGAQADVVIVGSGPGGLSAALSCAQLGLSYVVVEKQRHFSWTIRNFYHKGKPVMAEPHDVEMTGLLPHWDTNREELLGHWEQVIQQYGVQVQYSQNVTNIEKQGQVFTVTATDKDGNTTGSWTGMRVVIAIGTMGNPRQLGCPGDDLEKVNNALVDPDEFQGQNILVVGGTDAAIEVVMALCEKNKVWVSCRRQKFDRVKPKNLQMINEAIEQEKCIPLFATKVTGVTESSAVLEYKEDGRQEEIPNDVVFAMIGGHPPIKWLQKIGVSYTEKPHSWSPPRTDDLARETTPEG